MRVNNQTTAKAFQGWFAREEEIIEGRNPGFAAEQDKEIILSNLHFAEKLFPDSCIGLCPISHTRVNYFSKNCEHILGHLHSTLIKMSLQDFFALVHPDDLPSLQQCFTYIRGLMPFDPELHRFVLQYRIRNQDNEYVAISNENMALKVTDNSYLYLMLYRRASGAEKFYHVKLDIYKKRHTAFVKTSTYNPKQREKEMTPRQNDITRLVIKGYTNQEIADQLGVSLYTVKNHKKVLFRKINVKNSIELTNYVQQEINAA